MRCFALRSRRGARSGRCNCPATQQLVATRSPSESVDQQDRVRYRILTEMDHLLAKQWICTGERLISPRLLNAGQIPFCLRCSLRKAEVLNRGVLLAHRSSKMPGLKINLQTAVISRPATSAVLSIPHRLQSSSAATKIPFLRR